MVEVLVNSIEIRQDKKMDTCWGEKSKTLFFPDCLKNQESTATKYC